MCIADCVNRRIYVGVCVWDNHQKEDAMKYSETDLIDALKRLSPHTETMLKVIFLPKICEKIAVDLFIHMDELSDTDIQLSKDISLLRQAMKDLEKGCFNFKI